MAGFANNMTRVLNNIETLLGLKMIQLPDKLAKDKWPEDVIQPITIHTFSAYYPNQVKYRISSDHPMKDGWYYIDEDRVGGLTILGIQDIDWSAFGQEATAGPYGIYDTAFTNFGLADIACMQAAADVSSLFNNNIFIEYKEPNMFRLVSAVGNRTLNIMRDYDIKIITEHSPNLTTISPTIMQTFEDLARADVAGYLYNNLKYWDGLETAYATLDLKLDKLEQESAKRDDIIQILKDTYVSAANNTIPYIMTI